MPQPAWRTDPPSNNSPRLLTLFSCRKKAEGEAGSAVPLAEKIYETVIPSSLVETKLLVKTTCEDPEVQAARAEVVKSKSVAELSQITSMAEIPVPEAIENFVKRGLAPAERKKKFKDK